MESSALFGKEEKMNRKIIEIIKEHEMPGDFTYATVNDETIADAENILDVKLPGQYVDYIKTFGHGGIGGIEILGVGRTGKKIFVDETIEYRKEGLPKDLVVVENVDEWLTCVECNTGRIVSWDFSGEMKEDYHSFDDYLLDQMASAIENM